MKRTFCRGQSVRARPVFCFALPTMRAFLALALAAVAFAADPTGQTVLAPAASQTSQAQGTTVLNAQPGQPSSTLAPNFKPAIVESASGSCGCHAEPVCPCAPKPEYVAPELKCEVSPCGVHASTPVQSCGCLHLETCACKIDYVAPEIADFHHAPEVVEALAPKCGCDGCHQCPEETHVAPEIVETPKCGCSGCDPCAALHSNVGAGTTILHPTTVTKTN